MIGDEPEPGLIRVLIMSLMSNSAFTALWSYIGIWAATRLDASSTMIGVMFTLDSLAAAGTGYWRDAFPTGSVGGL